MNPSVNPLLELPRKFRDKYFLILIPSKLEKNGEKRDKWGNAGWIHGPYI